MTSLISLDRDGAVAGSGRSGLNQDERMWRHDVTGELPSCQCSGGRIRSFRAWMASATAALSGLSKSTSEGSILDIWLLCWTSFRPSRIWLGEKKRKRQKRRLSDDAEI